MVDKLADIGGTMGLLTGFSFISFVEILYYAVKILLEVLKQRKGGTPPSPPSPPSPPPPPIAPAIPETAEYQTPLGQRRQWTLNQTSTIGTLDLALTERQIEKLKFSLEERAENGK